MGRGKSPARFQALIEAATRVFIDLGYRRTQMADVAAAMGVAKGTVYLYVESKEALFDLSVRQVSGSLRSAAVELPYATPPPGATLREVEARIAAESSLPALAKALETKKPRDVRVELESILRELYALLSRNRVAIKLIDRCAHDHPELASVWYRAGRVHHLSLLERYLASEGRRAELRALPSPAIAARMLLETITFWAVHRYWDPAPQEVDDQVAEESVIAFLLGALVKE